MPWAMTSNFQLCSAMCNFVQLCPTMSVYAQLCATKFSYVQLRLVMSSFVHLYPNMYAEALASHVWKYAARAAHSNKIRMSSHTGITPASRQASAKHKMQAITRHRKSKRSTYADLHTSLLRGVIVNDHLGNHPDSSSAASGQQLPASDSAPDA